MSGERKLTLAPIPLNAVAKSETVLKLNYLLQLNRTQFPSLGIFVSKKVGNPKNKDHFCYNSFKSCIQGGLSLFDFQLFH